MVARKVIRYATVPLRPATFATLQSVVENLRSHFEDFPIDDENVLLIANCSEACWHLCENKNKKFCTDNKHRFHLCARGRQASGRYGRRYDKAMLIMALAKYLDALKCFDF